MQNTVSASPRLRRLGTFNFEAKVADRRRSYGTVRRTVLLGAALLTCAAPAPGAPGDLDASFGDHGRVSLHIGSFGAQGRSVIEQPDGTLVIAGEAAGQFTIARLTRAGVLDTTFAGDGVASLDFGGFDDVGYVVTMHLGAHADVVDLHRIAVDPDHRRRGLGHALLAAAIEASGPGRRMLLEVSAANAEALEFYATEGFTEITRRPRYYRDGSDAVVMERMLDD